MATEETFDERVGRPEFMVRECGVVGVAWGVEPYAEVATYLAAADTRARLRRLGRRLEGVDGLFELDEEAMLGEEVERVWFRCGREVGGGWRLWVFRAALEVAF